MGILSLDRNAQAIPRLEETRKLPPAGQGEQNDVVFLTLEHVDGVARRLEVGLPGHY